MRVWQFASMHSSGPQKKWAKWSKTITHYVFIPMIFQMSKGLLWFILDEDKIYWCKQGALLSLSLTGVLPSFVLDPVSSFL